MSPNSGFRLKGSRLALSCEIRAISRRLTHISKEVCGQCTKTTPLRGTLFRKPQLPLAAVTHIESNRVCSYITATPDALQGVIIVYFEGMVFICVVGFRVGWCYGSAIEKRVKPSKIRGLGIRGGGGA